MSAEREEDYRQRACNFAIDALTAEVASAFTGEGIGTVVPRTGKTKRLMRTSTPSRSNISRSVEMAGQKRSEYMRSTVVLVGVLERLTKIVTPRQPRGVEDLDSLNDLVVKKTVVKVQATAGAL
jgi:hypothetical protein